MRFFVLAVVILLSTLISNAQLSGQFVYKMELSGIEEGHGINRAITLINEAYPAAFFKYKNQNSIYINNSYEVDASTINSVLTPENFEVVALERLVAEVNRAIPMTPGMNGHPIHDSSHSGKRVAPGNVKMQQSSSDGSGGTQSNINTKRYITLSPEQFNALTPEQRARLNSEYVLNISTQ